MAVVSGNDLNHGMAADMEAAGTKKKRAPEMEAGGTKTKTASETFNFSKPFTQKMLAEALGTFFLIFAGCGSVVVDRDNNKVVTLPGIAIVWGLAVLVLVHAIGHISGAHLNPAITIAFASCKRFPLKQVPGYIVAQLLGSTLAAGILRLLFTGDEDVSTVTLPVGSTVRAFVIEFIITFHLMFVISAVVTDDRAFEGFAGIAIGATISLTVMFAGGGVLYFSLDRPITGPSMNPARSLGSAIAFNKYKDQWIYLTAPILGALSGAWAYNVLR